MDHNVKPWAFFYRQMLKYHHIAQLSSTLVNFDRRGHVCAVDPSNGIQISTLVSACLASCAAHICRWSFARICVCVTIPLPRSQWLMSSLVISQIMCACGISCPTPHTNANTQQVPATPSRINVFLMIQYYIILIHEKDVNRVNKIK